MRRLAGLDFQAEPAGLWSWSWRLGLETVSWGTNVSSGLDKNCQRLGLSHLSLVPKTLYRPNCEGHIKKSAREMIRVGSH